MCFNKKKKKRFYEDMHLSPLPTSDRILSVLGSGSVCVNSLSNVPPIGLSGFCVWSLGFGSRFVMRYTSTTTLPHSAVG